MEQKLLNGIGLADRMAARSRIDPKWARHTTSRVLAEAVRGHPLRDLFPDQVSYHSKVLSLMRECERTGIPPELSLAYATITVNALETRKAWLDCHGGQLTDLLIASNTSEVQTHHVFFDGQVGVVRIDAKPYMRGGLGICINLRNERQVDQINDFVPFSYSLLHNSLPAAIVFFGAWLPEPGKNLDVAGMTPQMHASLILRRKNNYVRAAKDAKHFVEGNFYHHFDAQGMLTEIPILATLYNGATHEVCVISDDGRIGPTLQNHLLLRGLLFDPRLASISANLDKFKHDEAYPHIMQHSRAIKEVGCVDARINRTWDLGGLIKEIGSALAPEEMRRIATSQLSGAVVLGTHTHCGYVRTFIHVHNMNICLGTVLGDEASHLRKIVNDTHERLVERACGAVYEPHAVDHALSDTKISTRMRALLGEGQQAQLRNYLLNLISYPASDLRETIRHGLERGVISIGSNGLFAMRAAAEVDEVERELIPGSSISQQHHEFLVNEAHTRLLFGQFDSMLQKDETKAQMAAARGTPDFDATALVRDLKSGLEFLPQQRTPQTKEELFDSKRELFYREGAFVHIPTLAESISKGTQKS